MLEDRGGHGGPGVIRSAGICGAATAVRGLGCERLDPGRGDARGRGGAEEEDVRPKSTTATTPAPHASPHLVPGPAERGSPHGLNAQMSSLHASHVTTSLGTSRGRQTWSLFPWVLQ